MFDALTEKLLVLVAIILSITVHEFAHAKSAELAGDPTPRAQGRITLNPVAHFDPLGFLMILITVFSGFGIGWGKPVAVNPRYFRHPRLDFILVAAWGPFSNIILAVLAVGLLRLVAPLLPGTLVQFLLIFVIVNVWLALFNLIPIHPLDGSKIIGGLLPDPIAYRYWSFMVPYGPLILLTTILILPYASGGRLDLLDYVLAPVAIKVMGWLLGGG